MGVAADGPSMQLFATTLEPTYLYILPLHHPAGVAALLHPVVTRLWLPCAARVHCFCQRVYVAARKFPG